MISVYSNLWSIPQSADVLHFYAGQYENEVNLIPMFYVRCCPGVKPSYTLLKNCVSFHKIILYYRFFYEVYTLVQEVFLEISSPLGKDRAATSSLS